MLFIEILLIVLLFELNIILLLFSFFSILIDSLISLLESKISMLSKIYIFSFPESLLLKQLIKLCGLSWLFNNGLIVSYFSILFKLLLTQLFCNSFDEFLLVDRYKFLFEFSIEEFISLFNFSFLFLFKLLNLFFPFSLFSFLFKLFLIFSFSIALFFIFLSLAISFLSFISSLFSFLLLFLFDSIKYIFKSSFVLFIFIFWPGMESLINLKQYFFSLFVLI